VDWVDEFNNLPLIFYPAKLDWKHCASCP